MVDSLARENGYASDDLPDNLSGLLETALGGQSEKEEVAAAVALCRAGRWDEGLSRFAELVQRRPNYPDYRTRHAAALYQLRRDDEAFAEVEAALDAGEFKTLPWAAAIALALRRVEDLPGPSR